MYPGRRTLPLRLYAFPAPLVSPEKAFARCGVPVRHHFRGPWRRGVAVRHRFRGLWRRDAPLRRHSGGFGGCGVPLRQHSGGLGGRDAGVRGYGLLFFASAGGIIHHCLIKVFARVAIDGAVFDAATRAKIDGAVGIGA